MDSAMTRSLTEFAALDDALVSRSGSLDLDAHEQRLLSLDHFPTDPPFGSHGQPKTKRKVRSHDRLNTKPNKRTAWRAKDKIEHLRRLASDLELIVAIHADDRQKASQMAYSRSSGETGSDEGFWKGVATGERRRLRVALEDNQKLVALLHKEFIRGQRLDHLVQNTRRQYTYSAIPRNPTPLNHAVVLRKHQELLAAVSVTFQSLRGVLSDSSAQLPGEEFRSAQQLAMLSDPTVSPGMMLVHSGARRLVPLELAEVGESLWGKFLFTDKDAIRDGIDVHHVQRLPQSHSLVVSIQVPTDEGNALFRVMGVRARFPSGSCDVVVTAGASAPASAQSTTLDVRSWTIAQPHTALVGLSEVRFHADVSWALAPSCADSPITRPQTSSLDDFVGSIQNHMLTKNDQLLDALLLAQQ